MEADGSSRKALPIEVPTISSKNTLYQANFSSAPDPNCAMIDTASHLAEEPMTDSLHTGTDPESAQPAAMKCVNCPPQRFSPWARCIAHGAKTRRPLRRWARPSKFWPTDDPATAGK